VRDETEFHAGRTDSGSVRSPGAPDDHPLVPKLSKLFGEHTFFLNSNGLNVVGPNENAPAGAHEGTVVNIANWSDAEFSSLAPHGPELTEIIVMLETEH
jgi:hypothetical protein